MIPAGTFTQLDQEQDPHKHSLPGATRANPRWVFACLMRDPVMTTARRMRWLGFLFTLTSIFLLPGCANNPASVSTVMPALSATDTRTLATHTVTPAPSPSTIQSPTSANTSTRAPSPTLTLTPAPTASGNVKLLFAYSPGCEHCDYQKPIIDTFTTKHPEVAVTQTIIYDLDAAQKDLIQGTSGHPIMVFYAEARRRQIVGETALDTLEVEYQNFKAQTDSQITTGSKST